MPAPSLENVVAELNQAEVEVGPCYFSLVAHNEIYGPTEQAADAVKSIEKRHVVELRPNDNSCRLEVHLGMCWLGDLIPKPGSPTVWSIDEESRSPAWCST